MTDAEIGVFGGSGFYAFLDDPKEVTVDTPYGAPSAAVTIGSSPFGCAFVAGRNRVPRPAAGITAVVMDIGARV